MRTVFTIKTNKDLALEHKPGSDYYLGQTLSRLEVKKRDIRIKKPPLATLASGSLLQRFPFLASNLYIVHR